MAYAPVQDSVSDLTGGDATMPAITVTTGSLLVTCTAMIAAASRRFTTTDDNSNTWSVAEEVLRMGTISCCNISYAENANSGSTIITSDISAGTANRRVVVSEWSGGATSSALDTSSQILSEINTTTHYCSADGTVIDTVADALVIAMGCSNASTSTITKNANYTELDNNTATYSLVQYRIASGTLSNERATYTTATSRHNRACMASFAPAAGGGGGDPPNALIMGMNF